MKLFWNFEQGENAKKLKITRECSDICKSIFKRGPCFLHPFIESSIQKYRKLDLYGIEEGYEIFERFVIRENETVLLVGAIILPECRDETDKRKNSKLKIWELDDQHEAAVPPYFPKKMDQQMVYSLNFYELNDKDEAISLIQFQLYEGEGTNTIVRGKHDDILNFIISRGLQTKNQGGRDEGWLGQNIKKLRVVSESVLILAECYFFLMEKCFI